MSETRLAEIKTTLAREPKGPLTEDTEWLVARVEALQAEVESLKNEVEFIKNELRYLDYQGETGF